MEKIAFFFRRVIVLALIVTVSGALVACQQEGAEEAGLTPAPPEVAVTPPATPEEADAAGTPTPEKATPSPTPAMEAEVGEFPVSIIRSDGVTLEIEQRPERIISLSPGGTEMFFAIGAGDQLVAAETWSDYPPEAEELPKVDAFQPDPEAILAHDPDLVLITYDADGIVAALDEAGISVLYLEVPESLDALIEQARQFGEITGNTETAEELAVSMEERIEAITSELADVEKGPRIYHELDDTFFTVSPESFVGDLYNLLKAQNIAAGASGGYPQLSAEVIIEQNPEVIILPTGGNEGETTSEDVKARSGWDVIDAVQNDRIYEIDRDILSRPGPRIVDGMEQLADLLYPEKFAISHDLFISQVAPQIAA